jgi:alpha-aminoadipate carrier protein LysW
VIQTTTWITGFFYIQNREGVGQMNECIECGATVQIPQDVMENEILPCLDCGVELEVITINPLILALAPEVEEDWGE